VKFEFGSGEVRVWVTFESTMSRSGSVPFRWSSGSGHLRVPCSDRFGWNSGRVCYGLSIVAQFGSSVGQV